MFSRAAVELLSNLAGEQLQFVFFSEVKGEPYWIMSQIPKIADMSDESIANAGAIFCLPGNELREVLVKEVVPKLVVERGLKGFEFRAPDQPHLKALFKGENVNAYPGVLP